MSNTTTKEFNHIGLTDGTKLVANTALNASALIAGYAAGALNTVAITIANSDEESMLHKLSVGKAKDTFTEARMNSERMIANLFSPTADIAKPERKPLDEVMEVEEPASK